MTSFPLFRIALFVAVLVFLRAVGFSASMEQGRVSYGGLEEKGLTAETVLARRKAFAPLRQVPVVRFPVQSQSPERRGYVDHQMVEVMLLERAVESRAGGEVAFGFPLAQGALFDANKIRIVDPASGKELPTQVHLLAHWPDQSLKSLLIQFRLDLKKQESGKIAVEFGDRVSRKPQAEEALRVHEGRGTIRVTTGPIEVAIDKERFIPFAEVNALLPDRRRVATSSGIELEDETGLLHSTAFGAPQSVRIERMGIHDAMIRVEGPFSAQNHGSLMRYIARLRFLAGSSRVDLAVTLINSETDREFTDIRRLGLDLFFPKAGSWETRAGTGERVFSSGESLRLVQTDENTVDRSVDGETMKSSSGRLAGWLGVKSGGERVQVAVRDFWQRWPKGWETKPGFVRLALLPSLSGEFGKNLPDHLRFPFVENHYRLKWGMSVTERLSIDFGAEGTPQMLLAEVNTPILAIVPPDYLASTKVFGRLPGIALPEAEGWNRYMDRSLEQHRAQRRLQREYGHLNWGDWFGERGYNWGNNEYDRARGFFAHFFASGKGAFYDDAVAAARHQADVDIVHAYPDPFYLGANVQHGIGHTGVCYQAGIGETWTYPYDHTTSAGNGHTWADGMADCWLYTGDPVVMESLLALGEHLHSAFVPTFTKIGTHERSAGWSLLAALATYRATSDPAFLEVANRIVRLTLTEWDPQTGIWQHSLPPAHAGGREGVVGNSLYNLGILIMALGEYHAVTQDPAVLTPMRRTCEWFVRSYHPAQTAWPYSATVDGQPTRSSLTPNLNPLIYPGLAYSGMVMGEREWVELAAQVLVGTFEKTHSDPLAKELSIKAYGTTSALGILAEARSREALNRDTAAATEERVSYKEKAGKHTVKQTFKERPDR